MHVLGASAISQYEPHFHTFVDHLNSMCSKQNMSFVVNVYDGHPRNSTSCIRFAKIEGFKGLFWKHALKPIDIRGYDYLWLFDSDLQVQNFDALRLADEMRTRNVLLAQPLISGVGRTSDHKHLRISTKTKRCFVECANIIEVMTPVITQHAWVSIYDNLLHRIPTGVLRKTIAGIDVAWCPYLQSAFPSTTACGAFTNFSITHDDRRSMDHNSKAIRSKKIHRSLSGLGGTLVEPGCMHLACSSRGSGPISSLLGDWIDVSSGTEPAKSGGAYEADAEVETDVPLITIIIITIIILFVCLGQTWNVFPTHSASGQRNRS